MDPPLGQCALSPDPWLALSIRQPAAAAVAERPDSATPRCRRPRRPTAIDLRERPTGADLGDVEAPIPVGLN